MTTFDLNRIHRETSIRHVEHHETLDSTNKLAAELLPNLVPLCPSLVLATTQTAGRGRGTNSWWANTGSLTFSLVLKQSQLILPSEKLPLTALATGVAVRRTLAALMPDAEVSIKWPNDVLLNERKVCGILTEQRTVDRQSGIIVGVGVNINNSLRGAPDEFRHNATSAFDSTGCSFDLTDVLVSVLNDIESCVDDLATRSMALLSELNRYSILNDRTIAVEAGERRLHGRCLGIDEHGALLLATESGPTPLIAGTVVEW